MAWSEAKAWLQGSAHQNLYQALLDDAAEAPARNARRKKVVRPSDMPWEMSRQGLLKHLLNEGMKAASAWGDLISQTDVEKVEHLHKRRLKSVGIKFW